MLAHRKRMLEEAGGPTLATAIELVADGRVTLLDGEPCIDGKRGYFRLGRGAVRATPPGLGDGD